MKHGMSHTRIYRIWKGMNHRCYVKSNTNYPLNEIKDEYEDIIPYKNARKFIAIERESGNVIESTTIKGLSDKVGLSKSYISMCFEGIRNSKKYIFERRYQNARN